MLCKAFAVLVIVQLICSISSESEEHFDNSLYDVSGVDREKLKDFLRLVRNAYKDTPESWPGRWFPDNPNEPLSRHRPPVSSDTRSPYVSNKEQQHINFISQLINPSCDDAKTNLTLDWDGSPEEYLCLLPPSVRFQPDSRIPAIEKKHLIPSVFRPPHICMDRAITYPEDIVTFGPHRPAWAAYGEYKYVPPQRWIHNLEHGAIVLLYHPCSHPSQINILKDLVRSCLFRHIITPSRRLSPERPLALLAWGWSLTMSEVSPQTVLKFIRTHALHAPEEIARDGIYNYKLVRRAQLVSDEFDTRLCPYSF